MPPHCDSLDGPVVTAARHALAVGDVDVVLPYVPADGEDEIREAFNQVLPLQTAGDEATGVRPIAHRKLPSGVPGFRRHLVRDNRNPL